MPSKRLHPENPLPAETVKQIVLFRSRDALETFSKASQALASSLEVTVDYLDDPVLYQVGNRDEEVLLEQLREANRDLPLTAELEKLTSFQILKAVLRIEFPDAVI